MSFSAYIVPDPSGSSIPNLKITPQWYRSSVMGGCKAAEFSLSGELNQLWLAVDFLGREIQIYDERNQPVWWGMVNEVRVNIDGAVFGLSLDGVANSIAVAYSTPRADGNSDRATTAFTTTADSVAKFGTKQLLYSLGDSSDDLAIAKQRELLDAMSWPRGVVSFDGRPENFATLYAIGWIETLKWQYFTRLEGRIEFEGGVNTPGISQAIGWGSTSTQINFKGASTTYTRTITGATNTTPSVVTVSVAHGFNNGDVISISGVGGNTAANGSRKLTGVTATTFELTDPVTGDDIAGNGDYTSGGTASKIIEHSGPSRITYGKPITGATNATPVVVTCTSHGFTNGDLVTISDVEGNAAANGTYKVASAAASTFALTDVDFVTNIVGNGDYAVGGIVSNDAVAGPFGSLVDGQIVAISGSASNNGSHTLLNNAGNNGKTLELLSSLTTEVAGASVTLSLTGYRMAQQYVQAHAFALWRCGLKLSKAGSPTDSVQIELQTDSAGSPSGTVVATCTLSSAQIGSAPTWYWLDAGSNPALTASASYWLAIKRSGALSDTNYYLMEMDATAHQNCKAYNASTWVAHPNEQYVPFRVWGWEDTLSQAQRILTDCGDFLTGGNDTQIASSIKSNQYRNGDLTAYDEFVKLLSIGNSAGQRLICTTTIDRRVQMTTEPTPSESSDILAGNNHIRRAAGGLRAKGDLPVGEWLIIDKAPLHLNAVYNISPQFIDGAEYSVGNDRMRLVPKRAQL